MLLKAPLKLLYAPLPQIHSSGDDQDELIRTEDLDYILQ